KKYRCEWVNKMGERAQCRHFICEKTKGVKEHGSRVRRPTFLFVPQFRKSRDNHPHAGRQNHGGQRLLPQIPLLFFEYFLFQLAFVCSAMTKRVTDQVCARHPLVGGRGDWTLPYAVSFRSATELTWGMKMGSRHNRHEALPNAVPA